MSSRDRRRSRSRSPNIAESRSKKLSGPDDRHQHDSHRTERRDENRRSRVSPERRRDRNENLSQSHENFKRPKERQEERKKQENKNNQNNERTNNDRENFVRNEEEENPSESKEEPNFELSGKLAEYTNTYKGVVIKYNEPPEALKPKTRWRLYPFKGDKDMPVLYIHRQSAYLIGRQRHIVDLSVDHPSCSKQHAVLQYRLVSYERNDGAPGRKCKPYIIDLESANGTFLNNQKIEARRYYELKEKDVLKFGFSSREYVLLNEKTKGSEVDDDVEISPEQTEQKVA